MKLKLPYYSITLILFLHQTVCLYTVHSSPKIKACNGFSKLNYVSVTENGWSFRWQDTTFSHTKGLINDALCRLENAGGSMSCKNGDEIVTFNKEFEWVDIEQPPPYPHFTPSRYIATEDGHFYSPTEYCIQNTNITHLQAKVCKPDCGGATFCIRKCCAVGNSINAMIFNEDWQEPCLPSGPKTWKPFLYSSPYKDTPSEDNYSKDIHYVHHILNCSIGTNDIQQENWFNRDMIVYNKTETRTRFKLMKDGSLWYVGTKRRWEKLNTDAFCIDGLQGLEEEFYSGKEMDQIIFLCQKEESFKTYLSWVYMVVMYFASIFLFLTCVVYILLWDKQNIHGWTVFSLVISMFFMFEFLATAHLLGLISSLMDISTLRGSGICVFTGIMAHLFFLSTFTWLSIINFDLWWTFKSLESMSERSKGKTRFVLYNMFAWGLPLIVISIGCVLDEVYSDRDSFVLTPEYGAAICFVAPWAQGVYIYYIIACLLVLNCTVMCTTFYNLYQFKKGTSIRSNKNNEQKQKCMLVGKLSVIMGISWIFEFISWVSTEGDTPWWWVIPDLYNLLQAVLIFIIFICKPNIAVQLEQKYPALKSILGPWKSLISGTPTTSGSDENNFSRSTNSGRKISKEEKPLAMSFNSRSMKQSGPDMRYQ